MRVIARRATMLAGYRSRGAISPLRALSRVSQFPELCALARILFYVTLIRIRVFMCTLESNLLSFSSITLYNSRLFPAILICSILRSSSVQ